VAQEPLAVAFVRLPQAGNRSEVDADADDQVGFLPGSWNGRIDSRTDTSILTPTPRLRRVERRFMRKRTLDFGNQIAGCGFMRLSWLRYNYTSKRRIAPA
ncbi:MAG TPA: hypothetical protein VL860_09205, partial [Planctomycetota bacterium]|nr:hypothetical protein [Planctomycetota bacterium]